jgi:ubiquinone biosynthesis protein UbiJ
VTAPRTGPRVSAPTYNQAMAPHPLNWLADFAAPRTLLLLNHVLSSEPVASAKLQAHAGKFIDLRWEAPTLAKLPAPLAAVLPLSQWASGAWRFLITPAGLLEWVPASAGHAEGQGLTLSLQIDNPVTLASQALRGQRPDVTIEGDVALAEVAAWLMKNLRWDMQDDVARWLGGTPAEALRVAGARVRDALMRWRPGSQGDTTAPRT